MATAIVLSGCGHTAVVFGVAPAAGGVAGYYMTEPPEDPAESRLGEDAWGNIIIGVFAGFLANLAGAMIIEDGGTEGLAEAIAGVAEVFAPPPIALDPPSTAATPALGDRRSVALIEERTSCVRLEIEGPEWLETSNYRRQHYAWGYSNQCTEKVMIVAAHRYLNSDGQLDWFTRTHFDGLDAGAETGIGFDKFAVFSEDDWGRRPIPTPLVVYCAATFESVRGVASGEPSSDAKDRNYEALQTCRDNKMR